ncbi:hypothetical protein L596_024644 [Steinernema carpocapsae]|uniref:Uncharacterized protein n=1 Tax=Steinernema carpocapsae TaxID=34508 RepID=A0A4U5M5B7_STECR|nr:hypothetical protein L596_024644 [Steinernema carpocapsae]
MVQILDWDVPENLILAVGLCIYLLVVLIAAVICCAICPEKFFQTGEDEIGIVGQATPEAGKLLDLTCFYNCCPCGDFSLRYYLKKLFPSNIQGLRRLLHCECIRPAVQGSTPYKVDLICCTV